MSCKHQQKSEFMIVIAISENLREGWLVIFLLTLLLIALKIIQSTFSSREIQVTSRIIAECFFCDFDVRLVFCSVSTLNARKASLKF